jgi:hypothetical protein
LGATNPKNSANTAVSKYDYHDFAPHFYSKMEQVLFSKWSGAEYWQKS